MVPLGFDKDEAAVSSLVVRARAASRPAPVDGHDQKADVKRQDQAAGHIRRSRGSHIVGTATDHDEQAPSDSRRRTANDEAALNVMKKHRQLHTTEWRKLTDKELKRQAPLSQSTFVNVRNRLLDAKAIVRVARVRNTYRLASARK